MNQLTELLGRLRAGDAEARNALFAAAYADLHRLARSRLRDGGRNTVLDTTGLVHESFLRFLSGGALRAEDRRDRKSTRLNSSHVAISYAVFCLKKKTT